MKHKISKTKKVNKILNELTEDIKDRIILIEIKRNGKVNIYLKENQKGNTRQPAFYVHTPTFSDDPANGYTD